MLSRPTSRARWLLAHTITAALGALAFLLAFGVGLGIAGTGTDSDAPLTLTNAAILRAPAAWVFVALTTFLLATVPRAAAAVAFIVLGLFLALEFAVELRRLPPKVLYASPFALVPQLPTGPAYPFQTILLMAIVAGSIGLATRTVPRQDIP